VRGWYIVAAIAALVFAATGTAIALSLNGGHKPQAESRIGACVSVTPDAQGELHSIRTKCDTDLSFTVGALAKGPDDCQRYDRFQAPFADAETSRLCLVPNLVAGHCYRFGVPVGMWDPVDCSKAGPAAIRVIKRVDVNDTNACPDEKYKFAMTYSSPDRTYCTESAQ